MAAITGEFSLDRVFRVCDRKLNYKNQDRAEKTAAVRSKKTGHVIVAYKCRFCGGWHIGHPYNDKAAMEQYSEEMEQSRIDVRTKEKGEV